MKNQLAHLPGDSPAEILFNGKPGLLDKTITFRVAIALWAHAVQWIPFTGYYSLNTIQMLVNNEQYRLVFGGCYWAGIQRLSLKATCWAEQVNRQVKHWLDPPFSDYSVRRLFAAIQCDQFNGRRPPKRTESIPASLLSEPQNLSFSSGLNSLSVQSAGSEYWLGTEKVPGFELWKVNSAVKNRSAFCSLCARAFEGSLPAMGVNQLRRPYFRTVPATTFEGPVPRLA